MRRGCDGRRSTEAAAASGSVTLSPMREKTELELLRGNARPLAYRRFELNRDIALGALTVKQLAAKYQVTVASIMQWKKNHKEEIDNVKQRAEDALMALPLADKVKRVAEIQDMYFELREEIDAKRQRGGADIFKMGDDKLSDLYGKALEMLKAIMVETGQMPARQTTQSNAQVTHVVVGIDMDAFKKGNSSSAGRVAVTSSTNGDTMDGAVVIDPEEDDLEAV